MSAGPVETLHALDMYLTISIVAVCFLSLYILLMLFNGYGKEEFLELKNLQKN